MKSAVETLSPTRVRLTIEVPFEELKPSVDAAYKAVARQIRVPGFRPGRVPAPIIDQRLGRGVVLEQALQEAVPRFYGEAVRENAVQALGHPDVEVTEFTDRAQLTFTAEVEVRPPVELPEYDGLPVTVDDADVPDEDVDEQLNTMRERFAVLRGVERPVQTGDYVSVNLDAKSPDGAPLPDSSATGMSYEVGSGSLLPGLDDVLVGMTAGETRTFTALGGGGSGQPAEVAVTALTVKEKELPALDDEFAQTASEFDTLDELRADVRARLERAGRLQQAVQARDKTLETLLEQVEVPIPEQLLESEIRARQDSVQRQLDAAGMSREHFLEAQGHSEEELNNDLIESARSAIKSQLVLDALAAKEELGVSEAELTDQLVRRAARLAVAPQQYAQQLMQTGQVQALAGEVLRAKALAHVLEHAVITDASGRPVDLEQLRPDTGLPAAGDAEVADTEVADTEVADTELADTEGAGSKGAQRDTVEPGADAPAADADDEPARSARA